MDLRSSGTQKRALQPRPAWRNFPALHPELYGVTQSHLHAGLPTDRLIAEWWLDSPHVKNILEGNKDFAAPECQLIPLPGDIGKTKTTDRASAEKIQTHVREDFQRLFREGYVATGLQRHGETAVYVLQRPAFIPGLTLPEYRAREVEY